MIRPEGSQAQEGGSIMRMNKKGFTLVEIMIVVAIIALLAAIAIPNLLRAKISANDALAKSTLRTMSTAAETYSQAGSGQYPVDIASLTGATPPYLNLDYCSTTGIGGFTYTCTWGVGAYTVVAGPLTAGSSGSQAFTITTGAILTE